MAWLKVMIVLVTIVASNGYGATGVGVRMGFPVFPIPGGGADVFYSGNDWTLGLSYASGSMDYATEPEAQGEAGDEDYSAYVEYARFKSHLALAEFRYFLFWGFHVTLGIGQRQLSLDYKVTDRSNRSRYAEGTVDTTSQLTHAGIGVMGRWESFFVGFDIIGVSKPAASKAASSMQTTETSSDSVERLNDDLTKLAADIGRAPSAQVLMLSLGAMM